MASPHNGSKWGLLDWLCGALCPQSAPPVSSSHTLACLKTTKDTSTKTHTKYWMHVLNICPRHLWGWLFISFQSNDKDRKRFQVWILIVLVMMVISYVKHIRLFSTSFWHKWSVRNLRLPINIRVISHVWTGDIRVRIKVNLSNLGYIVPMSNVQYIHEIYTIKSCMTCLRFSQIVTDKEPSRNHYWGGWWCREEDWGLVKEWFRAVHHEVKLNINTNTHFCILNWL